MLSKCANPECSERFLYLTRGQLFRLETEAEPGSEEVPDLGESRKPTRRLEYFWLCEDCARTLTLSFNRATGITIHPLLQAQAAAAG